MLKLPADMMTNLTCGEKAKLVEQFILRDRFEVRYHTFRRGTLRKQFGYRDDTLDKCRTDWPFTKMTYLQYRTIKVFLGLADEARIEYKRRSWYALSVDFGVSEASIRRAYYEYRRQVDEQQLRRVGADPKKQRPSRADGGGWHFVVAEECPGNPKDPRPQPRVSQSAKELRRRLPVA